MRMRSCSGWWRTPRPPQRGTAPAVTAHRRRWTCACLCWPACRACSSPAARSARRATRCRSGCRVRGAGEGGREGGSRRGMSRRGITHSWLPAGEAWQAPNGCWPCAPPAGLLRLYSLVPDVDGFRSQAGPSPPPLTILHADLLASFTQLGPFVMPLLQTSQQQQQQQVRAAAAVGRPRLVVLAVQTSLHHSRLVALPACRSTANTAGHPSATPCAGPAAAGGAGGAARAVRRPPHARRGGGVHGRRGGARRGRAARAVRLHRRRGPAHLPRPAGRGAARAGPAAAGGAVRAVSGRAGPGGGGAGARPARRATRRPRPARPGRGRGAAACLPAGGRGAAGRGGADGGGGGGGSAAGGGARGGVAPARRAAPAAGAAKWVGELCLVRGRRQRQREERQPGGGRGGGRGGGSRHGGGGGGRLPRLLAPPGRCVRLGGAAGASGCQPGGGASGAVPGALPLPLQLPVAGPGGRPGGAALHHRRRGRLLLPARCVSAGGARGWAAEDVRATF